MRLLLPAIVTALAGLKLDGESVDSYITPDPRWRPYGTTHPCIGIHDAGLSREEEAGEMVEIIAAVELSGFVALTEDGAESITGDTGVYALLDEATELLNNNLLGTTDIQRVQIGEDSPSEIYQATEDTWLVRVSRTLIYTIERSNA